jgi:subtilisin family serine protease
MDLPMINGLVLRVPPHITTVELANDYRVRSVECDQKLQWKVEANSNAQGSFIKKFDESRPENGRLPWGVLKLFDQPYYDPVEKWDKKALPANIVLARKALEARPIRIAVLDTGIYPEHRSFKNPLMGGLAIVEPMLDEKEKKKADKMITTALDDNGHGTHVAATIVAPLDDDFHMGEHANVELYAVKILDHQATGDLSNIVMAIQWCIDNDIDIVNMSVGYRHDSPALRLAVQEAYKAGLIMVASAGNKSNYDDSVKLIGLGDGGAGDGGAGDGGAGDGGAGDGGAGDGGAGDGGAGDGGAGVFDRSNELPPYATMYPARYPELIAVASSNMDGFLAAHSNFDETVDLLAPGTQIVSADITNGKESDGFGYCNGTSMAAPHVTAAVALMLALDPTLGPDEVRDILVQTADYNLEERVGNIDLTVALDAVLSRFMNQDLDALKKKELQKLYKKTLKEKMKQAKAPL